MPLFFYYNKPPRIRNGFTTSTISLYYYKGASVKLTSTPKLKGGGTGITIAAKSGHMRTWGGIGGKCGLSVNSERANSLYTRTLSFSKSAPGSCDRSTYF